MFLAAGYHVRVDVPAQLRAVRPRTTWLVADTFGPDPLLVEAAVQRLDEAGAGRAGTRWCWP